MMCPWFILRPRLDTAWSAGIQILDSLENRLEPDMIKENKCQCNDAYCYTHSLVKSPVVIREASPSNWCKQLQRSSEEHEAELSKSD